MLLQQLGCEHAVCIVCIANIRGCFSGVGGGSSFHFNMVFLVDLIFGSGHGCRDTALLGWLHGSTVKRDNISISIKSDSNNLRRWISIRNMRQILGDYGVMLSSEL
mmetsp:Transcript_21518/g.46774  ORF Transcript_21518/g.46774 Transcript_21518/m.46774 type:complete len:106 (-) Transcript_21518:57-374(-)